MLRNSEQNQTKKTMCGKVFLGHCSKPTTGKVAESSYIYIYMYMYMYMYMYIYGSFPKLGVPFWGSPKIRIIVFCGLYWGPPILGNYHTYTDKHNFMNFQL